MVRLLVGVAAVLAGTVAAGPVETATRDAAWDAVLTRESGWNAGDIGLSIDLGDGRTLWLFGDSIVGPVRDGSRVGDESEFVRGAIAWHKAPERGGVPEEIRFAIPEAFGDAAVAAWTRPTEGLWPEDVWYWLMGDGRVVRDADGAARFVFFASAIGPAGNPDGMWNFRRVGGAVITVENPGDAPDAWRAVQRVNPIVESDALHGEQPRPATNWGMAIVEGTEGVLFVYGVREGAGASELLVARCAGDDLDRPERWAFFDGASWSTAAGDAAAIARGLVSEFTVQQVERGGRTELVLIQSEPMLGRHVLARTAVRPEGPWSGAKKVYEVTEPAGDPRLMTYAAKGHAHLSRPGELLVSYCINSSDFGQLFRDGSLSRPRFVRLPVAALPESPEVAVP